MFAAVRKIFSQQTNGNSYRVQNMIDNERTGVYSPDVLLLEQKANHLVFLYCDRQTNHPRSVDEADHVWWGQTEREFLLWKHELGKLSYPIVTNWMPEFKRLPHLPVRGEVVRMRTHRLLELDRERDNPVKFKRVRVNVDVPHHQMTYTKDRSSMERLHRTPYIKGDFYPLPVTTRVEAWMYVGVAKYWREQLDGLFSQGKPFLPNKIKRLNEFTNEGGYYFFPPNSYT